MCIESDESREKRKRNEKIEKILKEDKAEARKQVKLLLLGTGESGKSTFMKQMRIIHENGFSKSELEKKRVYVFHNTIQCMQLILQAMKFMNLALDNKENISFAMKILTIDVSYSKAPEIFSGTCLPQECVVCIESLWKDKGVQACYERRNQFQLSDSAEYFFTNVSRFGETNYIPTNDDIVRIRVPTTGIIEHVFCIKSAYLRIVDVGGQDNERLKWINCFEGVTSIIFITALNEYDMYKYKSNALYNDSASDQLVQFLEGDDKNRVNRMHESLCLFQVITSLDILVKTSFILFLNKKDLLEEKIKRSPLKKVFTDFDGQLNNAVEAGEFIREMFIKTASLNSQRMSNSGNNSHNHNHHYFHKTIYAHFTCATDTENIKFVFDSVKHTILNKHIEEVFLNELH